MCIRDSSRSWTTADADCAGDIVAGVLRRRAGVVLRALRVDPDILALVRRRVSGRSWLALMARVQILGSRAADRTPKVACDSPPRSVHRLSAFRLGDRSV